MYGTAIRAAYQRFRNTPVLPGPRRKCYTGTSSTSCSPLSILLGDIVGSTPAINLNVMQCIEPNRCTSVQCSQHNIRP